MRVSLNHLVLERGERAERTKTVLQLPQYLKVTAKGGLAFINLTVNLPLLLMENAHRTVHIGQWDLLVKLPFQAAWAGVVHLTVEAWHVHKPKELRTCRKRKYYSRFNLLENSLKKRETYPLTRED
jgi:hypothetical protein